MKYFVPDIRVAEELGLQSGPLDKLGGQPWGLPKRLWPSCKECGCSQSFVAQIFHHSERFNLGRDSRCLFLFQCSADPGNCATWQWQSGANCSIVVEVEDMEQNRTEIPEDLPAVIREVRVLEWLEREDLVDSATVPSFFDDHSLGEISGDLRESIPECTKLGSVPAWIQSASEAPPGADGWRFVGQLSDTYQFLVPPKVDVDWLSPTPDHWHEHTHVADGPNFGTGIAYLFVDARDAEPRAGFFWQC